MEKKVGRPKTKTNGFLKTETNGYETEKPNNNDNENENVNENENNNNKISDSCVDGLSDVIDFYNNNIGQLTQYGLTLIEDYVKEMGKDVVIYAMKISVEADKRTIQYIKAILNNWSKKGIKTLAEAQKESGKKKLEKTHEFDYDEKTLSAMNELYDN